MAQVLQSGTRLGPFVLDRRVALGGMAEVWSATSAASQNGAGERRFAIKVLRDTLASDPQLRLMFMDEVRIAEHLRHPNIVQVEGVWEDKGWLFAAMEFVEGKDLRRILSSAVKTKKRLPIPLAVLIAKECARGLGYAHEARSTEGEPLDIVHRDVSPHNVMLTRSGVVKVLDFGIAKARERLTKTAAGVIKGKIAYMAPEQALAAPLSPRTDVFALGIVLWEMLAMRRLFMGDSDVAVLRAVCEARVPPIRTVTPEVPERLAALVAAMLALRQADRPDSMRVVEDELERVLVASFSEEDATRSALAAWMKALLAAPKKTPAMSPEDAERMIAEGPRALLPNDSTSPDAAPVSGTVIDSKEQDAATLALVVDSDLPSEAEALEIAQTEAISASGPLRSLEGPTVGMPPLDLKEALAPTRPTPISGPGVIDLRDTDKDPAVARRDLASALAAPAAPQPSSGETPIRLPTSAIVEVGLAKTEPYSADKRLALAETTPVQSGPELTDLKAPPSVDPIREVRPQAVAAARQQLAPAPIALDTVLGGADPARGSVEARKTPRWVFGVSGVLLALAAVLLAARACVE